MLSLLLTCFVNTAHAVPLQLTQQGRLVDNNGVAATGSHNLTFRIYNAPTSGSLLWEETVSTNFTNGYYSAILGGDIINNPLADSVLESGDIYIELEVDTDGPLLPRKIISATPYARIAGKAEVADSTDWSGLTSIPADIDDGDNDALGSLICAEAELPVYNISSGGWECGNPIVDIDADNRLVQLETLITSHTTEIGNNSTSITTNSGSITNNSTNIATNSTDIADNVSFIEQLVTPAVYTSYAVDQLVLPVDDSNTSPDVWHGSTSNWNVTVPAGTYTGRLRVMIEPPYVTGRYKLVVGFFDQNDAEVWAQDVDTIYPGDVFTSHGPSFGNDISSMVDVVTSRLTFTTSTTLRFKYMYVYLGGTANDTTNSGSIQIANDSTGYGNYYMEFTQLPE